MGINKGSALCASFLLAMMGTAHAKADKPATYVDALQRANAVCHIKIDSKANPDAFSKCLTDQMAGFGYGEQEGE